MFLSIAITCGVLNGSPHCIQGAQFFFEMEKHCRLAVMIEIRDQVRYSNENPEYQIGGVLAKCVFLPIEGEAA